MKTNFLGALLAILFAVFGTGCSTLNEHPKTIQPPQDLKRIKWYNRVDPIWWFGNADDPTPPDWYRPDSKCRTISWYVRNPFYNFQFYVIGIADKRTIRSGKYPERITPPEDGWNFTVSSYGCIHLPFVSYGHKSFVFYIGWRERGNFGAAIRFNKPKK